jgi:hypothetical protein
MKEVLPKAKLTGETNVSRADEPPSKDFDKKTVRVKRERFFDVKLNRLGTIFPPLCSRRRGRALRAALKEFSFCFV